MVRRIRVGIDTGGTFTDIVAIDEDSGALISTKTPSTPADPALGFLAGIDKVLGLLGVGGQALTAVSHGTTVATNKLLEGRVDNLGFITTEGFRHLLEIARQSVPDGYGNSYFWVKPPRIVPADRVRTVRGRLSVDGGEIRPFDREDAIRAAHFFRDAGITAIGVCFLHSYANPGHELEMREVLATEHPGAVVSISCEVLREYREYERAITTLVDAAVKPDIASYVANIAGRLAEFAGPEPPGSVTVCQRAAEGEPDAVGAEGARDVPFYVMKSNGGVLSAAEVVHQPISTVLSGPAAGALGAGVIARAAGVGQVLTCDGGGTSTDVAVVIEGQPALTTEGTVGAYPTKIPMVDVVTVGAGGGSIAWLSPEVTLKVGPHSAGAEPGPACYGKGGAEPTITDAHLLLGRIPPHLLGGEIPLDAEAARQAIESLATRLGRSVEECATGVLEISAWNQANALRQVSVKRGLDVRDFTLVTFGGSGPLLACRLIDILGLDGALVPPNPGNVSAFGLLTVDVRNDYVRTQVARADRLDLDRLRQLFGELYGEADAALEREGFPPGARRFVRTADLRYTGQAFEVTVDVTDGDGEFIPDVIERVAKNFHAEHRRLYGYDFADDPRQPVEWVNVRVTGIGPLRTPDVVPIADGTGADGARTGWRRTHFDAWTDVPTYDRSMLGCGDVLVGPAVVEEFGSTVPLHPGFGGRVDQYGNLRIVRSRA